MDPVRGIEPNEAAAQVALIVDIFAVHPTVHTAA
jgi:hypothetical protein